MADITQLIDRGIPSAERYMKLTDSGVSSGDIIRVEDSLGRPAKHLTIETTAGCDLKVKINGKFKKAVRRQYPGEHPSYFVEYGLQDKNDFREYDANLEFIQIGDSSAAATFSFNEKTIRNMEVQFTTGEFEIILT